MSDLIAVAAVTKTLKQLITDSVSAYIASGPDETIDTPDFTVKPLDKARTNDTKNQVNLFLYQIVPSPHWQNSALPPYLSSGHLAPRPLALSLFYVVTAYGAGDDEALGQRLLAVVMRSFFDHPVLTQELLAAGLPASDLKNQVEPVRLTYVPMPFDEVAKLWSAIQIGYRLSVTYEVSIVLVDGTTMARSALPVLSRQPSALASTNPPFPGLTGLAFEGGAPSAELGAPITLNGYRLDSGPEAVVVLENTRLKDAVGKTSVERTLTRRTPTSITFVLPIADAAFWPAGTYNVLARFRHPAEGERSTNALSFTLAPTIVSLALVRAGNDVTISVGFRPTLWPSQRVSLLVGDQEIQGPAHTAARDSLDFLVTDHPKGSYFVRLRVDGVDSLVVDYSTAPPSFDPAQRVEEA